MGFPRVSSNLTGDVNYCFVFPFSLPQIFFFFFVFLLFFSRVNLEIIYLDFFGENKVNSFKNKLVFSFLFHVIQISHRK